MAALNQTYLHFRVATALALACAFPATQAAQPSTADIAQARDYVFAACLIDKYSGSPVAAEAEVWAGGLVERGSLSGEAYPELAQLAKRLAPLPQTSSNGMPMLMQSCVALYNSPTLRKKITQLLRK